MSPSLVFSDPLPCVWPSIPCPLHLGMPSLATSASPCLFGRCTWSTPKGGLCPVPWWWCRSVYVAVCVCVYVCCFVWEGTCVSVCVQNCVCMCVHLGTCLCVHLCTCCEPDMQWEAILSWRSFSNALAVYFAIFALPKMFFKLYTSGKKPTFAKFARSATTFSVC